MSPQGSRRSFLDRMVHDMKVSTEREFRDEDTTDGDIVGALVEQQERLAEQRTSREGRAAEW
eukprot:950524-Alexandrium_andersonii.AAC.1